MFTFFAVVYIIVCFFLILVVLLQSGKGGGMGAAFGGTSQQVFGGAGAGNILTRLTAVGAALFMLLSAGLSYLSSTGSGALEEAERRQRAKEEARSGAAGGDVVETPEPAAMSSSEGEAGKEPAPTPEATPTPEAAPEAPEATPTPAPAAEPPATE